MHKSARPYFSPAHLGLSAIILLLPVTTMAKVDNHKQSYTSTATQATHPSMAVFFSPSSAPTKSKTLSIDYSTLDFILQNIVIDFGPSDRVSIRVRPETGTRITNGHFGPAALEGNRIYFSKFSPAIRKAITNFRRDLEALGTRLDFATITRDQQLAYWYNLHNIAVIEQIALHYPVKIPDNILLGDAKVKLQDAKILNVKGVPLSLHDIRTQIVFANWHDPLTIYGFFHGSVGGPNILPLAFTGTNVRELLAQNADEFVNSLRGVRKFGHSVHVSRIYQEASSLFPEWQTDLRRHLLSHANMVVQNQLDNDNTLVVKEKFNKVADLMGGYVTGAGKGRTVIKNGYLVDERGLPAHVQTLLQNLLRKQQRLQRRERNRFRERIVIVGEDHDVDKPETAEQPSSDEQN